MVKFLCFLLTCFQYAYSDVETSNTGEQAMIASIRAYVNADPFLSERDISIGAGKSGCDAFKQKTAPVQVLLTWQWLDALSHVNKDTIIVAPKHAIDKRFKGFRLIPIEGVLHTTTLEKIAKEESRIPEGTKVIVMLAGDTQQENGEWALYKKDQLDLFLKKMPPHKGNVLFLNGPRTGKHGLLGKNIVEDTATHRTTTDYVTQYLMDNIKNNPWTVIDFKYGIPSVWGPALKYCLENDGVILVLPGESTSMISEALSLGIRPCLYTHNAMTKTSLKYVEMLIKQGKATRYPAFPKNNKQKPCSPQEIVVVEELKKMIPPVAASIAISE
jgi:hypothetical protein